MQNVEMILTSSFYNNDGGVKGVRERRRFGF